MPIPQRKPAAFSLAEIVMVVVIIGIVAAIATPRFSNAIADQMITSAAQRIVMDIERARQTARFKSTSVTLTFASNGDYSSAEMDDPDNPTASFSVHLADPPYRVDALAADFDGGASVTFDMYGHPNAGGTIKLRVGNRGRVVTVAGDTGTAVAEATAVLIALPAEMAK